MVDENVYYVNTKSRTGIAITNHPDAQWFPKAGFGLFMHWGISAVDGDLDISWGMMKDFKYSIAIAGSHGKTTATAMCMHALYNACGNNYRCNSTRIGFDFKKLF